MQTLLALAQKDRQKGQRRFFGANIGLCEPARGTEDHLWFSEVASQREEVSSVYLGSVAYFDTKWPMVLGSSLRHQISRAQKKGLWFDLRRIGDRCPYEDMLWIYERWRRGKLFIAGYLLKSPRLSQVLTYDCVFLWRGDRLVGFAPLLEKNDFVFIENVFRHESLPNGSLPFLLKNVLQAYDKPMTFGLSPNVFFLPKPVQRLLGLVYNFSGLAKARQNLHPSLESPLFLNYPKSWSRFKLSLYLMVLLFGDDS